MSSHGLEPLIRTELVDSVLYSKVRYSYGERLEAQCAIPRSADKEPLLSEMRKKIDYAVDRAERVLICWNNGHPDYDKELYKDLEICLFCRQAFLV